MNIKNKIPQFIKDIYNNYFYYIFTKKNKFNILSENDTIDKIISEKKSVSRFGDGEFKWILNIDQQSFQKSSTELSEKLLKTLKNRNDNLLICIPRGLNNVSEYTNSSKRFWKNFVRWYGKKIQKLIDSNYEYGDTNFTRWYIEYRNKTNACERLNRIKKIWNDRNIVIIEGQLTRMGVGNDLFDNCKNIERVLVPAINAFDIYTKILQEVKKISTDKLILLAIGPTATILAADLTKLGYQAIDVGHIDIEYEWYLQKATKKIPIDGKYVNEAEKTSKMDIYDHDYDKSIICNLGEVNSEKK